MIVAVLAMLTLIPAVLSLLGDRFDWPRCCRSTFDNRREAGALTTKRFMAGFWGAGDPDCDGQTGGRRWCWRSACWSRRLFRTSISTLGFAGCRDAAEERCPQRLSRSCSVDFSAGRLAPVEFVIDGQKSDSTVTTAYRVTFRAALPDHLAFVAVDPPVWNEAG